MHTGNNRSDDFDITLRPARDRALVVDSVRPKATAVGQVGRIAIEIYIDAPVIDEVWGHTTSDRSKELGGVLVGHLLRDGEPYLRVIGSLAARYTTTTAASLTFTHDTWADLLERMDAKYRDCQILGWYHSHPGHGVFMSNFDNFIHSNFFRNPWQFALVIDPVNKRHGVFCWAGERLVRSGYYLVGNPDASDVCLQPEDHVIPEHNQYSSKPASSSQSDHPTVYSKLYALTFVSPSLQLQLRTYGIGGRLEIQWGEPGKRFSGEA